MNFLSKESLMIGAVLAGIALVLTFIAGLFGGLSFGKIIVNSFFFTFLLGVIGIGASIMLEKMIPGIWSSDAAEQDEDDSETGSSMGASESSVDFTVGDDDAADDDEYVPSASKAYFPEMEGMVAENGDDEQKDESPEDTSSHFGDASHLTSTNVSDGYREINGKKFVDDPEEYAKAIKTMLLKDD